MSNSFSPDVVYLALDESLPFIHTTLVSYYGFTEPEAEAFKDTLAIWFHRVARRGGTRAVDSAELREQLLFVACKYARAFQLAKAKSGYEVEAQFGGSLDTPPEEVALALLNRIQPTVSPS